MLHEAIQSLRPNKGFTMYEDDPSTIIWEDKKVITPTQSEIDAAVLAVEENKAAEQVAKAAMKSEVLAKLGITADELAAALA